MVMKNFLHIMGRADIFSNKRVRRSPMVPIWLYFVIAGIFISAFMAIKTGRDERMAENAQIEQEGEVYMQRLESARDDKREQYERQEG